MQAYQGLTKSDMQTYKGFKKGHASVPMFQTCLWLPLPPSTDLSMISNKHIYIYICIYMYVYMHIYLNIRDLLRACFAVEERVLIRQKHFQIKEVQPRKLAALYRALAHPKCPVARRAGGRDLHIRITFKIYKDIYIYIYVYTNKHIYIYVYQYV